MISDRLEYVALVSSDPSATEALLGEQLGLERHELAGPAGPVPLYPLGRSALAVCEPGDPFVDGETRPGVHHVALGVRRLGEAIGQIAARELCASGEVVRADGLAGRALAKLPERATCGVRTRLTETLGLPSAHSSWIERIDHLGVASEDNRAADRIWSTRLGFEVESRQTDMEVSIAVESFTSDKYGVVYHSRHPEPVGGLRVSFITVGDCELEFLQNFDPRHEGVVHHDRPGNTRQDQGAIARYIASRGAGLHHLALKTPDIDALLARLGAAGATLIDAKGRPGSRRALIGFVHPKSAGGVLFHFAQRP